MGCLGSETRVDGSFLIFLFLKMLLSSLLGCSFFFRKCIISQFVKGLTPILCIKFVVSDPKQGWTGTICFVYFENALVLIALGSTRARLPVLQRNPADFL